MLDLLTKSWFLPVVGDVWNKQHIHLSRGVTGIFFWGGKVIFPDFFPGVKCFFPVENSHFGRPKTNFRRFQKWKKKKKKKGPHLFFWRFPASISNFPPFLLNFHPFSLFSLPLFSRYVSKNFPVRSLWGALCPPCPPPVTPLHLRSKGLK